jgi:GNAT superfamily N-acetyltransferase
MHRVRCAVRENALTDPARVTEASYAPYVAAGTTWVAVTGDGRIAGFASLDLADASVWALFVAPGHEGAGIGRALHDTLLAHATQRGIKRLSLTTARGTRAERFYGEAGWIVASASHADEKRFERTLAAKDPSGTG